MRALGLGKIVLFYAVMGIVAAAAVWIRSGIWALIPSRPSQWAAHLAAGIGVGVALTSLSRLSASRLAWAARLADEFRVLVGPLNRREALVLAVASGIGEEALFRGVLQGAVGIWLASAIFATLHVGPNRRFFAWTAMAFVAGLLFGLLAQATGALVAPIAAHVTVNYLNLRYLAQGPDDGLAFDG